MTFKITLNDGNGKFENSAIFNYSYAEEVTALEPTDSRGGTSQVSLSGVANEQDKVGDTHPNSKLMINNTMRLNDSDRGEIEFQVKKVSVSAGVASIVGDTVQARLNVERVAREVPHTANGGDPVEPNLLAAIVYYCSLVDIVPIFDNSFEGELEEVPVSFIGWRGNVWEKLKELCSGMSASTTENIGIEMYVQTDGLHFRKALQREADIVGLAAEASTSVDAFDAAKEIDVINYNTFYATNRVVYDLKNYSEDGFVADAFRSSIDDSLQVDVGQTLIKRFEIDATLASVNQPVAVSAISSIPYSGTTGEYVIVGSDDLPIQPSQWLAQGGSLKVALTENPGEIEITITAPNVESLPQNANPSEVSFAPYRVGVETSGEADYPALWITGTGVFFNKKRKIFKTGAPDSIAPRDSAPSVDNIFMINRFSVANRGMAAAQKACGPKINLNVTAPVLGGFGETVGLTQYLYSNRFRIETADYSPETVQVSAAVHATFSDFNAKWGGKTFEDFNAVALDDAEFPNDALKFNEFSVIPLMESE